MITNRIKRGANASLPNGAAGEPLFTTDTYDLYIGKGDGTNQRYQKYMADAINGTGVANQLAYFSGANTIAGSTFLTLNLTADNGYLILTGGATYKNADIWLNRYSNAWENAIRFQTNGTTDWYVGSSATGSNSDFEIYNYGTSANGIKIAKATNNVTVGGTLTATIGALATAATNFVTSDSGTLKSRTAAEVLSDIGAQATSEKGQNNGYASLDSGGKVPVAQLPNSIMEYKGNWNAATNTPTLADGTGNAGDVYLCNVAGTVDLGSGNITFAVGDWCVYNGTIWQKSINSNAVVSVNGQTGVVTITDISGNAGTATKLATERDFTINGSTKSFDGSANVSWTAADIGLTSYLPLTGGTLTNTGGSGTPILRLVGSSTSSYQFLQTSYNASLEAGKQVISLWGKSSTTKNSGYIGFQWNSDNGNDNFLTLGVYDANHILKLFGDNSAVFAGSIKASISALGSAATSFVVSDSGTLKSRSAAEVRSDIGALGSGFEDYGTLYARTAMTTYRDHSTTAYTDAPIRSLTNTQDNWIYLDRANAQWGIYHRNIDSDLVVTGQPTLKANSIAFIGANNLQAYICLADGKVFGKSFVKNGGLSTEFLKADGTVDSSTYITSWSGIPAGTRTNYDLAFQPTADDYAGFEFKDSTGDGAGYLLIRGNTDAGQVYKANGITLVADKGWLTLAQRSSSGLGLRLMTGTTSTERLKISTAGAIEFVNGTEFTYNTNTIWHSGNLTNLNQLTNGPGYLTAESDTLASVTGRGASTSTASAFNGGLTATKTAKSTYGIQIKGAFYGAPRLQLYDLAADSDAHMGLGVDMSSGAYEFSNYFPRKSTLGRWSVGSWAGDFGTGQYVTGYNEKLWVNETNAAFNVPLNVVGALTQSGNQVWHQGNLTNLNQLTNGPGYITSWSGIPSGYRENFNLGFRPPDNDGSYAGFKFATPGQDSDAGYLLIRGGADSDVYTQNGITLVADKGWLTLAQRTTASKGVQVMTGSPGSTTRLRITTAGVTEFVNGTGFTYNGNTIWHSGNLTNNNQLSNGAGYLTSVSWSQIGAGTRSNYNLVFQAPADDFAGFEFKDPNGNGAGYFLIRGSSDGGVYTANGIALVADGGWLSLVQRTQSGRGIRFLTGSGGSPGTRLIIDNDGNMEFNGGSGSGQVSTATPKCFRFNNDYSNGYTDASLKLYIFNSGATRQGFTAGPVYDLQYHSSGSSSGMHTWYVGNVEVMKIATTTGNLTVKNSVTAASFFEPSDLRLKNVIERNPSVSLNIDLVKYEKKDKSGIRYGYIAQEVKALMPELAEGEDILKLNYQDIHSIKIAALEKEIKELKQQLKNK